MFENARTKMEFGKIDLIKIFRMVTKLGLVEAKYGVEAWMNANAIERVDEIRHVASFMNFLQAFTDGSVTMRSSSLEWAREP